MENYNESPNENEVMNNYPATEEPQNEQSNQKPNWKWKGFGAVWLWICFIAGIILLFIYLGALGGDIIVGVAFLSILAAILQLVGISLLLFAKKKVGFFLTLISALITIIAGFASPNASAVGTLIPSVARTVILFCAIQDNWYYLG